MADHAWQPILGALEVGTVSVFCAVTVGAAGAVTGFTGKGVKSVVRNSAGNYTINLADSYPAVLFVDLEVIQATAAPFFQVASQNVASTTPNVVVQAFNGAAAATDPGVGSTVLVNLTLKNSSV